MSSGLDDVAAKKISEVVGTYIERVIEYGKVKLDENITERFVNFRSYLEKAYARCSTVRLIIDRDRLYPIKDVYVKGKFRSSDRYYGDDDILRGLREGRKFVVQGFGGIGKTMLLKHLWMEMFNEKDIVIPIFIELRRLNDLINRSIIPYIRAYISSDDALIPDVAFSSLLSDGRFVMLLDGFDELNDDIRKEIEKGILNIAYNYPKCGIIVSSRGSDQFESWEQFSIFHALPFDKDQVVSVINAVVFDEKVKKAFLSEIVGSKYDTYQSFLSTPLLSLMMLLTYEQFADIPEKTHIFYRYAFQTLYSLHDAAKESFQRKRKTELNEDDFGKVFAFFCLLSYKSGDYSFSHEKIVSYVDAAKARAGIKVDTAKYIEEAIESVNLIYRDGNLFSFVHRSFQEYFCAYCAVMFFQDRIADLINILPSRRSDSVLSMMYEMNTELIEDRYLLANYEIHRSEIGNVISRSDTDMEGFVKIGMRLYVFCHWNDRVRTARRFSSAMLVSLNGATHFLDIFEQFRPGLFRDISPRHEVERMRREINYQYLIDMTNSVKFPNVGVRTIMLQFGTNNVRVIDEDHSSEVIISSESTVEVSDDAYARIYRAKPMLYYKEYASWVKARYVVLNKECAAMLSRQRRRLRLDDEMFSGGMLG